MHTAVAIVPCIDLGQSQAFYEQLGFKVLSNYEAAGYRILQHPDGAEVHLASATPEWVIPERNAHGLYLYTKEVEALAAKFDKSAQMKPWGLKEFALSDPNGMLVRVGSFES